VITRRQIFLWFGTAMLIAPQAALSIQEIAEVTLRVEGMI
jgi:hypothetical protein